MLRRLGHNVPADASFVEAGTSQTVKTHASLRDLFVPDFRMDTVGLFGAFFFCLLANYIGILLIPVMLTGAGFQQAFASNALAAWNFGGVGGAIIGALIIQRLGSRITMLSLSAYPRRLEFSRVVTGCSLSLRERVRVRGKRSGSHDRWQQFKSIWFALSI